MEFLSRAAAIAWKDVLVEARARETLAAVLVFAFLVLVVFSFAFDPVEHDLAPLFGGIMWVAYFFAGTLALHRSFAAERANEALHGLLLLPGDRSAVYFGKFAGNLLFLTAFELVLTPAFFALLAVPARGGWVLAAVLFLGTVGFTAVGTWLAALTVHSRAGEVLLPVLLFPLLVPVAIGAVRATAGALAGQAGEALFWMRVLLAYDLVFLALPLWLFEHLVEA